MKYYDYITYSGILLLLLAYATKKPELKGIESQE